MRKSMESRTRSQVSRDDELDVFSKANGRTRAEVTGAGMHGNVAGVRHDGASALGAVVLHVKDAKGKHSHEKF